MLFGLVAHNGQQHYRMLSHLGGSRYPGQVNTIDQDF
jgi:hypothetical protein